MLPAGAEGEICVGATDSGPFSGCYTTMLGYWNRPEATQESLRDGVLHTGDVGMIDGDGNLWVRDRRSDLIIRGGANVYPAEVERVIEGTGLVAEASVVGRPHPRLGEEVVAFVSPVSGQDLDFERLKSACHTQLARYKIPVTWYVVESFPRNTMGKVLKSELRSWLADGGPTVDSLVLKRYSKPGRRRCRAPGRARLAAAGGWRLAVSRLRWVRARRLPGVLRRRRRDPGV